MCLSAELAAAGEIRDHHGGESFNLALCRECTARFLVDPPTPERLGAYYANEAGAIMHSRPGRFFTAMRRVSIARDLAPVLGALHRGGPVVDFGAGDGSASAYLHSRGYAVQAIDIYDGTQWGHRTIPYRRFAIGSDALRTSLFEVGGRPAEAVILRHVLEHLIDPRELLSVARAAGVRLVLAIVPNVDSRFVGIFKEDWFYWDPPRHLTFFNLRSLRRIAADTGYRLAAARIGGLDEMVTSLHRRLLLSGAAETGWRRKAVRASRPTGLLAGVSSAASAPLTRAVCKVLLSADV